MTYQTMTDSAVLIELGQRIARHRLDHNITQADLAKEAGISKRTLCRLEGGESTQLANLIRVLRVLGLLDNLDGLIPLPPPSPLEQLRLQGQQRRRASSRTNKPKASTNKGWTWKDSEGKQ